MHIGSILESISNAYGPETPALNAFSDAVVAEWDSLGVTWKHGIGLGDRKAIDACAQKLCEELVHTRELANLLDWSSEEMYRDLNEQLVNSELPFPPAAARCMAQ